MTGEFNSNKKYFILFSVFIMLLEMAISSLFIIGTTFEEGYKDEMISTTILVLFLIDMCKISCDHNNFENSVYNGYIHLSYLFLFYCSTLYAPILVLSNTNYYTEYTIYGCYLMFVFYGLFIPRFLIYYLYYFNVEKENEELNESLI